MVNWSSNGVAVATELVPLSRRAEDRWQAAEKQCSSAAHTPFLITEDFFDSWLFHLPLLNTKLMELATGAVTAPNSAPSEARVLLATPFGSTTFTFVSVGHRVHLEFPNLNS